MQSDFNEYKFWICSIDKPIWHMLWKIGNEFPIKYKQGNEKPNMKRKRKQMQNKRWKMQNEKWKLKNTKWKMQNEKRTRNKIRDQKWKMGNNK